MEDYTYQMVRRLKTLDGALSRNRHFRMFEDPVVKRASRLARHLKDLQMDIRAYPDDTEVGPDGEARVVISLRYPHLKATRIAYVSREEFELLAADPDLVVRLQ